MTEFKAGDVVCLDGDDVRMTVERVAENGEVICLWHDTGHNIHSAAFLPEVLKLAEPPPKTAA